MNFIKSSKILYILFFLFSAFLFAQEMTDQPTGIKKSHIKIRTEYLQFLDKKPVQTFLCQKKYYDTNGFDTLTLFYSITADQVFSKVWKKFDSKGNVTERRLYKRSDFVPGKKKTSSKIKRKTVKEDTSGIFVLETVTYSKYDEKGRFVKADEFDEKGNFLKSSRVDYKYDNMGRVIESNSYFNDEKSNTREVMQYDSSGNKVVFELHDYKGLKVKMLYNYNENGRIIKLVTLNNRLESKEIEESKYDLKGNRIFKSISDGDGKVILSQYFRYNRFGRMIEMKRETNDKSTEIWKMNVTYDKYGNVTSNTKFGQNHKPYRKTIFKHVYFN